MKAVTLGSPSLYIIISCLFLSALCRELGLFSSLPPSLLQAVQNYCKYVTTEGKTVSPVPPHVCVAALRGVDIL